mmetsp:Transcript_44893/g.100929  ORF Transcript_44893/g.100929 Transcript_44893/m.100929 type:complete len:243 (-) Transcript_44893:413-1141(-)
MAHVVPDLDEGLRPKWAAKAHPVLQFLHVLEVVRSQRGGLPRGIAEEHAQVVVHLHLHLLAVYVIGIGAKWIFQLHRDEIQGPQGEHLDEGEHARPPRLFTPLGYDERHDEPVQQQQAIACLCVREGEWHIGDLQGIMEVHHAVCYLLKRSGEDRGGDGKHARSDVFHDELLDPLENQLYLGIGVSNGAQTIFVDIACVDEFHIEGRDVGVVIDLAAVFYLSKCSCVQHAEKPDERVLKLED